MEEAALPRADELKAALIAEGVDADAADALARAAADLPPRHVSTREEIEARRAERRARIERDKTGSARSDG
jgi:hypothetical protein